MAKHTFRVKIVRELIATVSSDLPPEQALVMLNRQKKGMSWFTRYEAANFRDTFGEVAENGDQLPNTRHNVGTIENLTEAKPTEITIEKI